MLRIFELIDGEPDPEPHPDWVKVQQVTAADLLRASGGLFPATALFVPAVPARKD